MSLSERPDIAGMWNGYKRARLRFFEYRHNTDTLQKASLAVGFAALTGVAAQIRVPLSFTPVPITLQTFAVLLTGIALGARWGGASQAIYAGAGAAGVPWFTGMGSGLGAIFGPTGGYILGFVLAAAFVGYVTSRYRRARKSIGLVAVLLVGNFVVIYAIGLPWLFGWYALAQGAAPTLLGLLKVGLFPYVAGDLVKLFGAAAVGQAITPTEAFGPEQ